MFRLRRLGSMLLLILLIALWAWLELSKAPPRQIRAADGAVVHIIDGDSLRIGKTEIRIAGIDAPEYRQQCGDGSGGQWDCGKAAREQLVKLAGVGGLVCTERATDRYGRTLADCHTDQGDIGRAMMSAGLALGANDPRFDQHELEIAEARQARRGIWRGPHVHPAEWRKAQTAEQPEN